MEVYLREHRERLGLTLVQACRLVPCSPTQLSMYERGLRDMPLSVLARFAVLYHCHPENLVRWTEFRRPTGCPCEQEDRP